MAKNSALILFDDRTARDWQPFALTRPAGELRFGALTLRERAERVFGLNCLGHLTSAHLRGFEEPGAAPVVRLAELPPDRDLLFLSARAAPAWGAAPTLKRACALAIGDEICGWFAPAGEPRPDAAFLDEPASHASEHAVCALDGFLLERVWQLTLRSAEQVALDVAALVPKAAAPRLPEGVHVLGKGRLVLGPHVQLEPHVVLDTSSGPIWLDAHVTVRAFARLAGPAYVGPHSVLLGGPYQAVTIGPWCKVHGELEESVILGYSNKAHDGFLGHAYAGCWVNLGAGTTNSDLKNNYGTVRIWTPLGEVDSGEMKLGSLIGDHVKTAIGTLLNTGTVLGAGANVFGAHMPPKYVAPFRWGAGEDARDYDIDQFLRTAKMVMARRQIELSAAHREMLREAWQQSRSVVPWQA